MEHTLRDLFLLPTALLLASLGTAETQASSGDPTSQTTPSASEQEWSGSSVPCAIPLRWRLESIDPRFGLPRADAEAALRAAFGVWEDEIGGTVFGVGEAGHPISFEYDERQASVQRRRAARDGANVMARELETMTAQLEAGMALQRRENAALVEAFAAHRARTLRLNDEIVDWNQQREVPDSVHTWLMSAKAALTDEGRDLERRQEALRGMTESLAAESRRLNRDIEEYNRVQTALGGGTTNLSQAGQYDEEVRTRDGRVENVRRRIQVYRYETTRDLIIVLAHELGHALGLGHTDTQGAIMSEVSTSGESEATPRLHPRDIQMLEATCPGLRSSSGPG